MSRTIDNKVVELQFNNQDFEKNVATSISTLDKLKTALNLNGAAKGLEGIQASVSKISFSGLSGALDTVQAKFSALDTIAFTALQNITNKAIDAGEKLVKSLSVDNISAGWEKFGEKTQSVGTLLAQGYDIDTVNEQLEKLNWFTDETSYNFTDMVGNIAKFTASGQDLETSVTAMEGIANWAALSGQNAETASRAMYQLSQAMGSGVMRKEDYKSIQNASMDTAEFRQKVIDAAIALGTLKKTGEDTYSSLVGDATEFTKAQFTDKLTEGKWFTSDVMMKVFNEYSAAVDQIYEYAEEKGITASEAIKELGDSADEFGLKAFLAAQEARTFGDVLDSVKDATSTAWMNVFETIFGGYDESKKLWTSMANELYEVFATPVNNLQELLEGAFGDKSKSVLNMSDLFDAGFEEGSAKLSAFQKMLSETAKEHEIDVDKMIEESGSFAKSLEEGWLTADIFNEAIAKIGSEENLGGIKDLGISLEEIRDLAKKTIHGDFGDDWTTRYAKLEERGFSKEQIDKVREYVNILSKLTGGSQWNKLSEDLYKQADAMIGSTEAIEGMTDAQLKEKGYTDEEIAALRELAKAAKDADTPLGEFTETLTRPSGRELLSETIITMIQKIEQAIEFLGKVWHSVFPATTSEQIYQVVKGIHDFVENLGFSGKNLNMFRQSLVGVLSFFDLFITGVKSLGKNIFPSVGEYGSKFVEGFLRVTSAIGRYLLYLDRAAKKSGVFDKVFKPVGERLSAVFATISQYGGQLVSFIEEFFYNLQKNGPQVPEGLVKIIDKIKSAFSGLVDFFKGGKNSVSKITNGNLFDGIKSAFSGLINFIKDGKSSISKIIDGIIDAFGKVDVGGGLTGVFSFLKEFSSLLGGNLVDGLAAFLKSLGNSNFDRFINLVTGLATVGVGSSLVKTILQFKETISGLGDAFSGLSKIKKSFAGVLDSLKESLDGFAKSRKIKDLRNVAISIAILVGSLYVLSTIDGADLAKAIAGITALFGELVGSYILIDKFTSKEKNKSKFGTSMIMMAASLLILAEAVKKLSSLSWEEMGKGLVGVLGLLGEIVLFSKLMGESKVSIKTGIAMIAIAGALRLIAPVCKDLASLSWEEIGRALVGIGGLLGELAIFSVIAGKSKHIMSTALSMVIIGAALKILVSVVKDISSFEYDDVQKGLLTIGGLLAEIAAFTVLSSVSKHMFSTSASLVIIGGALKILVSVVKDISDIDYEAIQKGLLTIGGLLLEIAAFSIASSFGGNLIVVGAGLIALSAGIALLVPSFKALGDMDLASIGKALLALAGTFGIVVAAGMLIGTLAPTLIAAGAAFALIGAGVLVLGLGLIAIGSGLTSIGTGIRILAEGLGDGGVVIVESVTQMAKALIDLIPYLISKLAESIGAVCDGIIENAPKIGEAFKTMLITGLDVLKTSAGEIAETLFSLILTILEKTKEYGPQILDALGAIILDIVARLDKYMPKVAKKLISSVKGIVSDIVDAIKNFDPAKLTDILVGVGIIGAIIGGLAVLPALLGPVLAGIGSLTLIITAMGAAFVALGGLAQIPGVTWLLDEGSAFANKIGEAIGGFFGSIIAGLVGEASSFLPTLGENLASFMTNAQPFFDGLSSVGSDTVDSIESLTTALLKITAAELLDGIASFITGESGIEKFIETLPSLGSSLTEFADSLGDSLLNGDKITASTNLASILATLAAEEIPKTGGIVQWVMGESDLGNFAKQLPILGAGLSLYAEQIDATTFTKDKIDASTNLASTLAALAKDEIPTSGGIIHWIMGESDLSNFAKQLPILGYGLSRYAEQIDNTTFTKDKIDASTNLASTLAALAKDEIPTSGGIIHWIMGESDLGNFAKQLPILGAGLSLYAEQIDATTFTKDKIDASTNLASTLAALAKDEIPTTGGVINWIKGESDLAGFGDSLVNLATGLATYLNAIDEAAFSKDKVDASTNLASTLAALAKDEIPTSGGILQWIMGESSLGSFGDNIKEFGEGMASYYAAISESDINVGNVMLSNMISNNLVKLAKDLDTVKTGGWFTQGSLTGFGSEVRTFGEQLHGYYEFVRNINVAKLDAIDEFLTGFIEVAKTITTGDLADFKAEDMNQFGQALENLTGIDLTGFIDSIGQKTLEVKAAAEGFIGGFTGAFENIDTSSIKEAADSLISAFSGAFEKAESIGDAAASLISAISDGITKNASTVKAASETLVSAIIESLSSRYESFVATGSIIVAKIVNGIRSAAYSVNSAGRTLALGLYNTLSAYRSAMRNVGVALSSYFVNGLYAETGAAYSAGDALAQSAVNGASGHSLWSIGYNMGTSLAHGLRDALPAVTQAADEIVDQANRAAQAAAQINSPSKIWIGFGEGMGEGLILGLRRITSATVHAAEDTMNTTNDAMTSTVAKIQDAISAGINAQPVIRPVVDLTDVQEGMQAANSMFDFVPSMGVLTNLNAISMSMNRRNQNAVSNEDVVNAVNGLKAVLGENRNNYYVNGVSYADTDKDIVSAIRTLIQFTTMEGRA